MGHKNRETICVIITVFSYLVLSNTANGLQNFTPVKIVYRPMSTTIKNDEIAQRRGEIFLVHCRGSG